jgi:hypothetical protein
VEFSTYELTQVEDEERGNCQNTNKRKAINRKVTTNKRMKEVSYNRVGLELRNTIERKRQRKKESVK